MKLLFATRNAGKLEELRRLMAGAPRLELLSLSEVSAFPEVEETGATFSENARLKAVGAMRATGLVALADDSGLEVDALGGAPGVLSARYAGAGASDAQRNQKLLRELQGIEPTARTARFRCIIALARPEAPEEIELCSGVCEGRIAQAPRGEGGFGYDPVFVPDRFERTFAELSSEQKNRISHRGKAMQKLARRLGELVR